MSASSLFFSIQEIVCLGFLSPNTLSVNKCLQRSQMQKGGESDEN